MWFGWSRDTDNQSEAPKTTAFAELNDCFGIKRHKPNDSCDTGNHTVREVDTSV